MARLHLIKKGLIVNTIEIDADEVMMNAPGGPGWVIKDGVPVEPEPVVEEVTE